MEKVTIGNICQTWRFTFKHKEQLFGKATQEGLQFSFLLSQFADLVGQGSFVSFQSTDLLVGNPKSSFQIGIVLFELGD